MVSKGWPHGYSVWILAEHAAFGLDTDPRGLVVAVPSDAPPRAQAQRGWPLARVEAFWAGQGALVSVVPRGCPATCERHQAQQGTLW